MKKGAYSWMAITSSILGIVNIFFLLILLHTILSPILVIIMAIFLSLLTVIMGIFGLKDINKNKKLKGRSLALWGIILGIVEVVFLLFLILWLFEIKI
jgi:hypothetical protein